MKDIKRGNTSTEINKELNSQLIQKEVPYATGVLVSGIISILGAFCGGLPGLISGIIGFVLRRIGLKSVKNNTIDYTYSSLNRIENGRICLIIGTILSFILSIIFTLLFVFFVILIDENLDH